MCIPLLLTLPIGATNPSALLQGTMPHALSDLQKEIYLRQYLFTFWKRI
jgi:hypothetical protein